MAYKRNSETDRYGAFETFAEATPRMHLARVQSGGVKKRGAFIRFAKKGTADFLGAWNGFPLAVEAKAARGEQTEDQLAFEAAWRGAGGIYVLARTVDELAAWVRAQLTSSEVA